MPIVISQTLFLSLNSKISNLKSSNFVVFVGLFNFGILNYFNGAATVAMIKNIWLAEDDRDDVEFFYDALQQIDPAIQCIVAQNGRELLDKLNSNTYPPPDLIFLDVNMPQMDGWDCLAALKGDEAYRKIPVVMYSTSSAKKDADRAIANGALCFYQKPTNFTLLHDFLKSLYSANSLTPHDLTVVIKQHCKTVRAV
jgi:CheY-like chemotaxis protein